MQVRIGVQFVAKELVVETTLGADEVAAALAAALNEDHGVLGLSDEKGDLVLVPAAHIAYLEVEGEQPRQVGFGTL